MPSSRAIYCLIICFTVLLIFAYGEGAHAQTSITPTTGTGDLGTTVLPPAGNVYGITGGTQVNTNLFHSFNQFSVATGDVAQFQAPSLDANISNILGRVTGGNPSSIFGTVDSATYYPNANLFLMNPAGIIFGPNATLNVGGMVTFTTADSLRLEELNGSNPGLFHADPTANSVLTTAPVSAFGFLGPNPAAISVEGSFLSVQPGQSISLVGGNQGFTYTNPDTGEIAFASGGVTMTGGYLSAPSGQINLVSVASPGEVSTADFMPTPDMTRGNIALTQGATLDVSGDGAGSIRIVGGEFVADQAFLNAFDFGDIDGASTAVDINMTGDVTFTNGSAITLFGGGIGRVGDTSITGRNITFDGFSTITAFNFESPNGGGSITINSERLSLNGGATLFAGTFGSAPSGAINITASESVSVSGDLETGSQSSISNQSFGFGDSGEITIASKNVTVENLGFISTDSAFGKGGNITVQGLALNQPADSFSVLSGGIIGTTGGNGSGTITINAKNVTVRGDADHTSTIQSIGFGEGGSGDILMPQTETLVVADNARINLEVEDGNPRGSSIIIAASNSITLSNDAKIRMEGGGGGVLDLSSPDILIENQSALQTIAGVFNDSTGVLVKTNNLTLSGQSQINSSAVVDGLGKGGDVIIQGLASPAQSVLIDGFDSGVFTDTQGAGRGGNIFVNANSVTLQNGGTLSAKTSGTADTATGGSIAVTATDQVTMSNGATITASSSGVADAGNITITAPNGFTMQGSSVTTDSTGTGAGGDIKITTSDSATVFLADSLIKASVAEGAKAGGDISIDPQFVILQNSQILAQAAQGQGGNITITTNVFLPDATSIVNADSQFGVNGTVTIQSPYSQLGSKLSQLPQNPLVSAALVNQRCAAIAQGEVSSFIIAGRDTLPAEPGGWLTSPYVALQTGTGQRARGEGIEDEGQGQGSSRLSGSFGVFGEVRPKKELIQTNQTDQTNDPPLLSLRHLTPAGFLMRHFAESETAGCRS